MKEKKQSNDNKPNEPLGGADCGTSVVAMAIIKDHAYYNRTDITHITIPDNVVSIGDFAFARSGIQSIRIPRSVATIGRLAFAFCYDLKTVEFEHGVKCIKDQAFYCSGIEALHLPESVKTVYDNAFQSCIRLKTVTGLGNIREISNSLFSGCETLEDVVLPPVLKIIQFAAFYGCARLKNIDIPTGVTNIGQAAFCDCVCLEKVIMGDLVKNLERESTFHNCKSLKEVRLSNSLHTITARAFQGCESLREIILPPSVRKLDFYCFEDCTELESINIDHLTKIDRDAFLGCNKLPANMKQLPKSAVSAKSLLPADLLSYYSFDEIVSEFNVGDKLLFEKTTRAVVVVIFKGGACYDETEYLLVRKKDQEFFIEIDPERDDENNGFYLVEVFNKEHPLFPQLKEVYEQARV